MPENWQSALFPIGVVLAAALVATSPGCGATSASPGSVQVQNQLAQPSSRPTPDVRAMATASPDPVASIRVSQPGKTPLPGKATPSAVPTPVPPLYQQAIDMYAGLSGYNSRITAYGHLRDKVVGATITVQWQAPRLMRLQILDTNVLKGDETTLLYEGGNTVRVKAPQWSSSVLTAGLDDPRLMLQDGQRFDSMTIGGLLARFQVAGAQIKEAGDISWNGHDAQVYELHLPDDAARGIQKQTIGIERKQRYPLYAEQRGAGGIINQIVVDSFQRNPAFAPGSFTI